MSAAEVLLIIIVVGVLLFLVYYFLKGSAGRIDVTRPLESRVDQYLDQRFENLMREWSLVTKSKARQFEQTKSGALSEGETRVKELKAYESQMKAHLDHLEERLNALEKELANPERPREKKGRR